ncbi:MAG: twin-arginine translocase TatA/TatE family subunit [bacterium]
MYPLAIFGLGPPEMLLLFLIILVVFGAGKIPQIGSGLGKGIRNFRKAVKGDEEESQETPPPKDPPA